ncbi:hypothetical protein BZARG_2220 [Bizionia argentinensis JUB59]|uniref:C-type lysozyme inhibitor domain-containing protein n=1 Tax=Bizionia argentinensis JUB59 TaxID=1046627 RepID=G2EGB2_9FLAO|nr:hypothetical protein [Bizionia argentinensis]EGV42519.1 hypothetical protein BZARG_2220 [Bizionia argentinensis JUB59]
MVFNNTKGTVKAYLDGGEQIDLVEEKTAAGIWYKINQHEFRGKGNDITLRKDGEIIFERLMISLIYKQKMILTMY